MVMKPFAFGFGLFGAQSARRSIFVVIVGGGFGLTIRLLTGLRAVAFDECLPQCRNDYDRYLMLLEICGTPK